MSRHYGIIGNPLEHSFSAKYFTEKFAREHIDADYRLFPMVSLDMSQMENLDGYNVTFPYKEAIMPKLAEIDAVAEVIGAVNVVYRDKGYNTDYIGFMQSIRPLLRHEDKQALILGTGGAAKAIAHGLKAMNIMPTFVSRDANKGIPYGSLTAECLAKHTIIVNCTPLGMYPQTEEFPAIPYSLLSAKHILYDCIYNPEETEFLKQGKKQGARTKNGLDMLIAQAEAAWAIWNQNQ